MREIKRPNIKTCYKEIVKYKTTYEVDLTKRILQKIITMKSQYAFNNEKMRNTKSSFDKIRKTIDFNTRNTSVASVHW
jgi:hypothetical protein